MLTWNELDSDRTAFRQPGAISAGDVNRSPAYGPKAALRSGVMNSKPGDANMVETDTTQSQSQGPDPEPAQEGEEAGDDDDEEAGDDDDEEAGDAAEGELGE